MRGKEKENARGFCRALALGVFAYQSVEVVCIYVC